MLTDEEALDLVQRQVESQFPKTCAACGRSFASLQEYLRATVHLSTPLSIDAEAGDWEPGQPLGTMAMSNCACGSTLAIGTKGMSLSTMWSLLNWARATSSRRGISIGQLLVDLRDKIDARVLGAPPRP